MPIKRTSAKQSIRNMCYSLCHDDSRAVITNCTILTCPIWAHRPHGKLNDLSAYEYKEGKWVEDDMTDEEMEKVIRRKEQGKQISNNLHRKD